MWLFRVFLVLTVVPVVAMAEQAIDDVLDASRKIIKETRSQIEPSIRDSIETEENFDWLKGRRLNEQESNTPATTQQQMAWDKVMSASQQANDRLTAKGQPNHPKVPDDVLYVYFSLSMPDESIRSLFYQALESADHRKVIFVLRGWHPPNINGVVNELNQLFPEGEKLASLPNVQINPVLFQRNDVERVPTFQKRGTDGVWYHLVGETSIEDASERLKTSRFDGTVIGPSFEIEEPNILALIQERIASHNWDEEVDRTRSRIRSRPTTALKLPEADERESYFVDLSIRNNQDLSVQGDVFATRGTRVNPFDYLTTQQRFAFIDANNPAHIDLAEKWRAEHGYVTFISSSVVESESKREAIGLRLKQPIYELNSMIIQRFRLRAVPSLAYQDGKVLKVDIVPVARSAKETFIGS